jgi:O-antigen ligase
MVNRKVVVAALLVLFAPLAHRSYLLAVTAMICGVSVAARQRGAPRAEVPRAAVVGGWLIAVGIVTSSLYQLVAIGYVENSQLTNALATLLAIVIFAVIVKNGDDKSVLVLGCVCFVLVLSASLIPDWRRLHATYGGLARASGLVGSGDFVVAGSMLALVAVFLFGYFPDASHRMKLALVVVLPIAVLGIAATGSRESMIAALLGGAFATMRGGEWTLHRRLSKFLTMAMFGAGAYWLVGSLLQRTAALGAGDPSIANRYLIWRAALRAAVDGSVTGVGFPEFQSAIWKASPFLAGYPLTLAHNSFLTIWVLWGAAGLLGLLTVTLAALRSPRSRPLAAAMIVLALLGDSFFYQGVLYLFVILTAAELATTDTEERIHVTSPSRFAPGPVPSRAAVATRGRAPARGVP